VGAPGHWPDRRSDIEGVAERAGTLLDHWSQEERAHFGSTKDILLSGCAAHGDVAHPAVVRALLDHILIRRDAGRPADASELDSVHELGARLVRHVELEERELLSFVEQTLLRTTGSRLVNGRGAADMGTPSAIW
jgi:hypothetical protein